MSKNSQNPTKALAKREQQPIVSLSDLEDRYRGKSVNLIMPKVDIGRVPTGMMLSVRVVKINKADKAHTYPVEGGNRALTKHALDLVANAAGISWISEKRVDDRRHPHYCEFEVIGTAMDFDGVPRQAIGTKTNDLRDDAGNGVPGRQLRAIQSAAKKKDRDPAAQTEKAREYMTEQCASKARNRAIAAILGIKRSYSPPELDNPFIIPKLVPDSSHPLAQTAMMATMLGGRDALFSRPDPQVVDGRLIEASVERVAVAEDIDDDDEVLVDSDSETEEEAKMPPDMEEQEKPDADPKAKLKAKLANLYKHARDNEISLKGWEQIVHKTTGKRKYPELTAQDLDAIEKVVEERISQSDN